MYFNYDNLKFRYSPFPIGLAKPLMDPSLYKAMLANHPGKEQFIYKEKLGHKYTLSEHFNPKAFHRFIRTSPVWSDFYRRLKNRDFTRDVLEVLARNSPDLVYYADMTVGRQLRKRITNGDRLNCRAVRLKPRFEFSMLPADGGHILPHSDSASKVISMVDEGKRTHPSATTLMSTSRRKNRQAAFEEMEVVDTFEFTPNQAVTLIKTFNSWHSVRPTKGKGSDAMRKTLTINNESFT
jgi:hypothetical protein